MPISGHLTTMALADLLQWAGSHRKTGVLELERDGVCRRIQFRDGRIVACSSEDPDNLIGLFLVARGHISHQTLLYALRQQRFRDDRLGEILVDMGVMTKAEVELEVAAKAEETIYGFFDRQDADFRFKSAPLTEPFAQEVDLSVEEILLKGAQRQDDLERIRLAFPDHDASLEPTGRPVPADFDHGEITFQTFRLLRGGRTLRELLEAIPGSDYLTLRHLLTLYERGLIRKVSRSGRTGR